MGTTNKVKIKFKEVKKLHVVSNSQVKKFKINYYKINFELFINDFF